MRRSVFTPEYQVLIQHVVEARKAAQLTQAELAAQLGCDQSFVSKYERGVRRIDVVEFINISRAVGMDPSDLIKKIEPHFLKKEN